ncbi:MBOAT family protein [Mucilaginibacter galii]|uniref:MBOAT family O-acyltransferase n=1 Tax=Mucilaginibacter galii TaxID=2005073 RepID=UPI00166C59D2|nr:MBOAT family protein [Mucilaginibacter galii]
MLFNSIAFAIFLPIVFLLYWLNKSRLSIQNIILLVASYVFYSWWDSRFLLLLIFSTALDFFSGLKIYQSKTHKSKKAWLYISVIINLSFLATFKYFNFFALSLETALSSAGVHINAWTLEIVLPVGISFYTFHGLSYVFDIYHQRARPTSNFINYSLFVSFFPLLVAGPIERATHLLPQIEVGRKFDYRKVTDGLRQILWGLFKKVVIADQCASIVNTIFNNPAGYHGSTLLFGAILFSFQIYCDFSGYSDIALGTARLFGIELVRNFSYPYFSRSIAEFWRRWHISLSSWFRDYVYIPMGGSRGSKWQKVRNTLAMFLISGFWHGANWTFLAWGLFNGILFLPLLLTGQNRKHTTIVAEGSRLPSLTEGAQMIGTFLLITIGWIFFRANSIAQAITYITRIFSVSLFTQPELFSNMLFKFIVLLIFIEWIQRRKLHGLAIDRLRFQVVRWAIYILLIYFICYFAGAKQGFIYFQF